MKPIAPPELSDEYRSAVRELEALTTFTGPPRDFWPRYLMAVGKLTCAERALLYVEVKSGATSAGDGDNDGDEKNAWRRVGDWRRSSNNLFEFAARQVDGMTTDLASACGEGAGDCGCIITAGEWDAQLSARFPSMDVTGIVVRPALHSSSETCLVVALIENIDGASAAEMLVRLQLAGDYPRNYQANMASRNAGTQVERLATALDLSLVVNEKERFYACALAYCNAVAAQLKCDRVSLGWMEKGFVHLMAISRMEKFERTMEAAGALEAAMDEAFDQDEEITWPTDQSEAEAAENATTFITKDHEQYARRQNLSHLLSVPLRLGENPVGIVTCERSAAFSRVEVQQMRLACDAVCRRLADLKKRDRWFGARAAAALKEMCAGFLGPRRTWAKVSSILGAVFVALLIFWRVDYRAEAKFILRSDEVAYVTAPFDGFIDDVQVRSGDQVAEGAPILNLDRTDLELRRAAAASDIIRYRREMDKARAGGDLAQRGIAEALADQAQATLDLIDLHLSQTSITTPYDAIVVEGDQRERQGAPVKQGEVLFKLARTDSLFVEAKLEERDIHEVLGRETGEIAFVSQPKYTFPVRIEEIVPAALPGDEGNVFIVRCRIEGEPASWLRPGMSGVCKFNVEKRRLGWVLTHRTVDFLRMFFWW